MLALCQVLLISHVTGISMSALATTVLKKANKVVEANIVSTENKIVQTDVSGEGSVKVIRPPYLSNREAEIAIDLSGGGDLMRRSSKRSQAVETLASIVQHEEGKTLDESVQGKSYPEKLQEACEICDGRKENSERRRRRRRRRKNQGTELIRFGEGGKAMDSHRLAASVDSACFNPSEDDLEAFSCECLSKAREKCQGQDLETCTHELLCVRNLNVCQDWKENECGMSLMARRDMAKTSQSANTSADSYRSQGKTQDTLQDTMKGKCAV